MIEKMLFTKQLYNKEEKEFLSYYNGDSNLYPFKTDSFKFVIISCKEKLTKEMIYSFFEGLLNDVLCFEYKNQMLVVYHNKYRINFSDLHYSLSEDYGQMIKLFEGFSIDTTNIKYLNDILFLYDKYIMNDKYDYYSISDLIIIVSKFAPLELVKLKDIVLGKYLKDSQFEQMIKAMFKNNLNVSKTAYDIYMHRNTINNKIDVLSRDTGLEIQKFKDAVAIYELLK